MTTIRFILLRPLWLRYLLVTLVVTGVVPKLFIFGSISLFDFLFLLIVLLSIFRAWYKPSPLFIISLLIIGASNCTSLIFSGLNEGIAIESMYIFLRLTQLLVILDFVSRLDVITSGKVGFVAAQATMLSFYISVLYILIGVLGIGFAEDYISGNMRLQSVFGNANTFAYFVCYVFIVAQFYLTPKTGRLAIFILSTLLLIGTGSFSGLLLYGLLLFIYFISMVLLSSIVYKGLILAMVSIVAVWIASSLSIDYSTGLMDFLSPRFINVISTLDAGIAINDMGSASTRLEHIFAALSWILSSPYYLILGLGFGGTRVFIDSEGFVAPHNFIVNLCLMIGIFPSMVFFSNLAISLFKIFTKTGLFFECKSMQKLTTVISFLIVITWMLLFNPISYLPLFYIPIIAFLFYDTSRLRSR
jgi:hypothetical protein